MCPDIYTTVRYFNRYDAHLVLTTIYYPDPELASHTAILIRNLKTQGDKWLVDVASFYTFSPISMDFEKESPEYHEAFASYKYVKEGKRESTITLD